MERIFFILPSLCGLILFYLLPYLDVIKRSFSSPVTGAFTGLDNYWLVFGNKAFQLAVKNTVRFIITCVPILVKLKILFFVFLLAKEDRFYHIEGLYCKKL